MKQRNKDRLEPVYMGTSSIQKLTFWRMWKIGLKQRQLQKKILPCVLLKFLQHSKNSYGIPEQSVWDFCRCPS